MGRVRLIHGDALEVLETLDAESFDACLCDPPYGISFMGRRWDHGVPSSEVWAEVLRCLRPGASLMAFGGTRTYHRLAVAVEDAGFEVRDSILVPGVVWTFGAGFPKSLDVSKAIDKAAGAEREVVGKSLHKPGIGNSTKGHYTVGGTVAEHVGITAPATPEAAHWEGYGTALKPAHEPVVWAMKPVDGTFARNAIEHGVAGVNVDAGRVSSGPSPSIQRRESARKSGRAPTFHGDSEARERMEADGRICNQINPERYMEDRKAEHSGRFPANLILAHLPGCRWEGTKRVAGSNAGPNSGGFGKSLYQGRDEADRIGGGHASPDGTEEVPAWECVEGCPVLAMDRQRPQTRPSSSITGDEPSTPGSGSVYGGGYGRLPTEAYADSGTASRFFQQCAWEPGEFEERLLYYAKAATAERMVDGERLLHPTMKPLALATYLARMLLPPLRKGGEPRRLLVPFSGVGSEVIGALRAGWEEVVAIELDPDEDGWIEKSARRIESDAPLFNVVEVEAAP